MLRWVSPWALLSILAVGSGSVLGATDWARPVNAAPRAEVPGSGGWVKTELYLGGIQGGGQTVSEEEWSGYLTKVLTPAFPKGLTVYNAYGQIQQADGKIDRQPTRVVVIVHPHKTDQETSFSSVIQAYQRQFPGTKVMKLTISADQPQFFMP